MRSTKVGKTNLDDVLTKSAIFLMLLIFIPLLFSTVKSEKSLDMKIGSIATKKVVAPYNFYILKTESELKAEREAKLKQVPFYFTKQDSITSSSVNKLHAVLQFLLSKDLTEVQADTTGNLQSLFFSTLKNELAEQFRFVFSAGNLKILFDIFNDPQRLNAFQESIGLAQELEQDGIFSIGLSEIDRPNIVIVNDGIEETLPTDRRRDLPSVYKDLENKLLETFELNQTLILNYYFGQILKPNLIYNTAFTKWPAA